MIYFFQRSVKNLRGSSPVIIFTHILLDKALVRIAVIFVVAYHNMIKNLN